MNVGEYLGAKSLPKLVSLILCAGESSRMGQIKALMSWQNQSFLAHAVKAGREAGAHDICVVLGAHADKIESEIDRLQVKSVLNSNWQKGMGSSIKRGVAAIQQMHGDADLILVQLCDQPL